MIIILTGPDHAGKTTQTALLTARLGIPSFKTSVCPSKQAFDESINNVIKTHQELLDVNLPWMLLDRFHYPDELIYTPIVEQRMGFLGPDQNLNLQRWLQSQKTIFVVLTAPVNVLLNRHRERGDHYISEEHIVQIHTAYERFCSDAPFPTIRISTGDSSVEQTTWDITSSVLETIMRGVSFHEGSYYRTHSLLKVN